MVILTKYGYPERSS